MKIVATSDVQVRGYGIVRRGSVIDLPKERIDERIAANFLKAEDESRLRAERPKGDPNQPDLFNKTKEEMLAEQDAARKAACQELLAKLGLDGVKEQLAELRVSFNSQMSGERLAGLLLDQLGE